MIFSLWWSTLWISISLKLSWWRQCIGNFLHLQASILGIAILYVNDFNQSYNEIEYVFVISGKTNDNDMTNRALLSSDSFFIASSYFATRHQRFFDLIKKVFRQTAIAVIRESGELVENRSSSLLKFAGSYFILKHYRSREISNVRRKPKRLKSLEERNMSLWIFLKRQYSLGAKTDTKLRLCKHNEALGKSCSNLSNLSKWNFRKKGLPKHLSSWNRNVFLVTVQILKSYLISNDMSFISKWN